MCSRQMLTKQNIKKLPLSTQPTSSSTAFVLDILTNILQNTAQKKLFFKMINKKTQNLQKNNQCIQTISNSHKYATLLHICTTYDYKTINNN